MQLLAGKPGERNCLCVCVCIHVCVGEPTMHIMCIIKNVSPDSQQMKTFTPTQFANVFKCLCRAQTRSMRVLFTFSVRNLKCMLCLWL